MNAVICSDEALPDEELLEQARRSEHLEGKDLVREVIYQEPFDWSEKGRFKVVVYDCGLKYNILRQLDSVGCQVTVMPAKARAEEILALKPDGVMLSNGPGDPAAVGYATETIKGLLGKVPIFGICMGHQLLALALGGKTYKLKFGHHGGNHPVKDVRSGQVMITVQNHGFCVDIESLGTERGVELTHLNLNDQTCEGLEHKHIQAFSVQFHPEAAPGPHDGQYLFGRFCEMMQEHKN